jgi:putative Ca2+/H+ antiporter (TMEM165/GDT1 family)
MEAAFLGLERSQWLGMATSLAVIAAAELGDKTQLVCMSLAARHRPWPVLWGAVLAFASLNGLTVVFGATVAAWLPQDLVALAVAGLFLGFGLHALRAGGKAEPVAVKRTAHGLFFTAFALIFLAEFGDKTQIAVTALSTAFNPWAVWIGATLGLSAVSALGIFLGQLFLKRLSLRLLHALSGALFLVLAAFAFVSVDWRALWQLAQGWALWVKSL